MTEVLGTELQGRDFADLLDAAEALLAEIAQRTVDPGFLDTLRPALTPAEEQDWGVYSGDAPPRVTLDEDLPDESLPRLHRRVEQLSRTLVAAQTALVGHAVTAYESEALRTQTLGIPAGTSAFRNAREYLRSHLQVPLKDIRAHAQRAEMLMPRRSFDQTGILPPAWPVLAQSLRDGTVPSSSADHIATALDTARRLGGGGEVDQDRVAALLREGEQTLTEQASGLDPDVMRRVTAHWLSWFEAIIDPDGDAPSDAELQARQGLAYRGRRGHLHHWTVDATDEQHEVLMTLASAATHAPDTGKDRTAVRTEDGSPVELMDQRTREQRQLDGLVSALVGALALAVTDDLPQVAGARPHVAVTIDLQTLLRYARDSGEAQQGSLLQALGPPEALGKTGDPRGAEGERFISSAAFTGPISPTAIRRWLCDGTVLPVVLNGEGRVLDIGREQRPFPLRLRRAVAARDGGCSAPGCSMPAPWCEVHHIQHWEHGGPTSVDNGVLLCSHHHHAVHAGAWSIENRQGVPWFIPAAYLDPARTAQRNVFWRS